MALRKYLRPLNGLPDPKGPLSSRIPSAAIAEANRLVSKTRKEETETKKCRPYKKYSPSVQLVDMVPMHTECLLVLDII